MKESVLDVIRESARDLHEAGIMDDLTKKKFDDMCSSSPSKEDTPENKEDAANSQL